MSKDLCYFELKVVKTGFAYVTSLNVEMINEGIL